MPHWTLVTNTHTAGFSVVLITGNSGAGEVLTPDHQTEWLLRIKSSSTFMFYIPVFTLREQSGFTGPAAEGIRKQHWVNQWQNRVELKPATLLSHSQICTFNSSNSKPLWSSRGFTLIAIKVTMQLSHKRAKNQWVTTAFIYMSRVCVCECEATGSN